MTSAALGQMLQQAVGLHRSGRVDEAVRGYKKVLRKDACAVGALNLLGLAEFQLGHLQEAADALSRAARLNPDLPDIDYNLGRVLQAQGRLEEAIAAYQKAVAKAPRDAGALINLATVLTELKRFEVAVPVYRRAVALASPSADLWHNLANALKVLDRYDEALVAYQHELALRHDNIEALSSLIYVLNKLDRPEEALSYSRKLVAAEPSVSDHHLNLANALAALGRDDEAIAAYDRAIALGTLDVASWNKGLLLLSSGRFAEGWPLFQSRWKLPENAARSRNYPQPLWRGERVNGPLMIWGEQGLGDQILMASIVPDVAAYADDIVLEVDHRLVPVFQRSFPHATVVPQLVELSQVPIAAHAALGDLPSVLRNDVASFERSAAGYLKADQDRTAEFRERLAEPGKRIVGLSWASANRKLRQVKSAGLAELLPLLRLPNCRFIDLQYGDTQLERESLAKDSRISIEHLPDLDLTNDLDGLAALMSACDAVVTVSNTTAHFAAALGRPTYVLLSDGSGLIWYWMKRGDTTPFYAHARLFRKQDTQSWPDLVANDVVPRLSEYLATISE